MRRRDAKPKGELVALRTFHFSGDAEEFAFGYRVRAVPGQPRVGVTVRAYARTVKVDGETIGLSVVVVRKKLPPAEPTPTTSRRTADRIDGYDRDDLGESPDY